MMKPWREQRPIVLPPSRRERTAQTTVVDLARVRPGSLARCGCGHVIEPGDWFCGGCGVHLRDVVASMARH